MRLLYRKDEISRLDRYTRGDRNRPREGVSSDIVGAFNNKEVAIAVP